MTGRGREVAELMIKRQNNVLCVQETRWKGNKSKELGNECKLIYCGADGEGRKGVDIIVSESLKNFIIEVHRRNDRIMRIRINHGENITDILCVYAPQVGCSDEEKNVLGRHG